MIRYVCTMHALTVSRSNPLFEPHFVDVLCLEALGPLVFHLSDPWTFSTFVEKTCCIIVRTHHALQKILVCANAVVKDFHSV